MQENSKLVEQISRCINDILLNHSLPKTGGLLLEFSQVFNSVCADKETLDKLNQHDDSKKSFINTILGLFGLTLISDRNAQGINKDFYKQFIEIDTQKATEKLKTIAEALQTIENDWQTNEDKLTNQVREQLSAVEALKKEQRELTYQYKSDQEAYYISIQRILEELGPNPSTDGDKKLMQITKEALEQLDAQIVWEVPSEDNGRMFTIQKTGIKKMRDVLRPCIMKQEEVVLKGLVYQLVEEDKA